MIKDFTNWLQLFLLYYVMKSLHRLCQLKKTKKEKEKKSL